MRQRLHLFALILVLLAELPILIPPPFGLTDHLVFWKAGQLVLTGASPYDMAAWIDAQRVYDSGHLKLFVDLSAAVWVYPAWTAFLFVPFGLLPYPAGPWTLHLSYLAVGLFAALLFVRSLPQRWQPDAELAVALVAVFQPLVIADRYGQFGAFLLLGLVLVFRGLRGRSTIPLAAGAVLLFTKPQLFIVVGPTVLVILVRARRWRSIAAVAAVLLAIAVATTLRYPESLALFARGAADRAAVFTTYSSTWAFAHYVAGTWWPLAGAALVAIAIACSVDAVRRLPESLRLPGVLAASALLSLAVTPVDFHYDQVPLALAAILATVVGRRPWQIVATIAIAGLLPWLVFFTELGIGGPDSQSLSGVVPLLIAPMLWFAARSASPATMVSSLTIANTPAKLK
ncbi:MAG TPA: glycosyltransferase 87 family protein [Candidatus Limnocylindria bacterium]|nr:glycosyltransferase 87 family protein [Candidatus Limnocylindria bacterium]